MCSVRGCFDKDRRRGCALCRTRHWIHLMGRPKNCRRSSIGVSGFHKIWCSLRLAQMEVVGMVPWNGSLFSFTNRSFSTFCDSEGLVSPRIARVGHVEDSLSWSTGTPSCGLPRERTSAHHQCGKSIFLHPDKKQSTHPPDGLGYRSSTMKHVCLIWAGFIDERADMLHSWKI